MAEKKYKAIDCPVCDEFYFSPLTEEDIEDGENGLDRFCYVCGWKYNPDQIENPLVKDSDGNDITELKKRFLKLRKHNKNYNYLSSIAPKPIKHKCPVCGKYTFKDENDHDICPICNWENDSYGEEYPDSDGGANAISLNESRRIWNSKK